ncbi:MAG: ankyrin repeat domain-containing protein, partial [Lysobacteraceae bacterium]
MPDPGIPDLDPAAPDTDLPEAAVVATPPRPPRVHAGALAAGVALTMAAGAGAAVVGGIAGTLLAGVCALLAQPAFALGLRGGRPDPREAGPIALLWAIALLAVAVLLAWPLSSLRQGGSLGAALAVSSVAGVALVGLWRTWPLWRWQEGEGGDLRTHWRALVDTETRDWRGLGAALLLALPLLGTVLLAWPELLPATAVWAVAGACALAWPLAHRALLRLPSPSPVRAEDLLQAALDEEDADAAAIAGDGEDLEAALYDAARHGRVERALALLDAGAHPHAPPPADARDQRSLPMLAAVLPDLRLLRTLIAHGVDLNAAHAGVTPLISATRDSWHGRPEAVMTLLANGADPRIADADGNTPLHHAARSSDPGVAALLRDAGAEIDPPNRDGLTPLALACTAGNWRLARFLLERGAKPDLPGAVPALLAAAGGDEDDPAGVQLLLKHRARAD